MSAALKQVLESVLALPESERWELVEAILEGFDQSNGRPFDETWVAEAQRRSAEFDAGRVTPIPWSEVRELGRRGESGHAG